MLGLTEIDTYVYIRGRVRKQLDRTEFRTNRPGQMRMAGNESRTTSLQRLQQQLQQIERSRRLPAGKDRQQTDDEVVSTGISPLDKLLPAGGFRRGTIVEWLSEGGAAAADLLALLSAQPILQTGGALVVIDREANFYPPAASVVGMDLENMIVVRPNKTDEALWTLEQSLRSGGVAVSLCRIGRCSSRVFRRLQLAVEAGGGLGFLIRPAAAHREVSWAEVRLLVQPLVAGERKAGRGSPVCFSRQAAVGAARNSVRRCKRPNDSRRLRVELLRCRTGETGRTVELNINDETGLVHSVSQLATAAHSECAAGA